MKNDFLCPNCRGYLSVGDRIVFTIKKKGWSGGILLLSPLLGDYSYENHSSYKIDPGEKFEFHCPICDFDFSVKGTDNLARIIMMDEAKTAESRWIMRMDITGDGVIDVLDLIHVRNHLGTKAGE